MDSESKRMARRAAGFCRAHGLLKKGDRVLAAVSGGPDSMAMLDLLCLLRGELGLAIGVAHLNHGLRGGESDGDQQFVKQTARNLGLPFHTKKVDVSKSARSGRLSIETAARDARKTFLERTARRHGYSKIATGHTRGDQAETVLMHLIRGGGSDGLCGIPVINGRFIRPLLGIGRQEVMAHLARRQLGHRIDSSNLEADAFRNRIRLELMPLLEKYNPRIEEAIARTAEALSGDREALSGTAADAARRCVDCGKSELSIDLGMLKGYNKGLQRNIIRSCCQRLLGPGRTPDLRSTDRALGIALAGRVGQSSPLAGGLWARRGYRHLRIGPAEPKEAVGAGACSRIKLAGSVSWNGWRVKGSIISGTRPVAMENSPHVAYFDLGGLDGRDVRVGPPRPGLRMRLFGSGGTRKVQDIFVDAKVPREERGGWPVIYAGGQPVWLAGLRRSDQAPVSAKTRRILRLEIKRDAR